MTREEQLKDIIAKASKPEVKAMAEAELQKLGLMKKAADGDELARTLVALKEAIDKTKGGVGSSKGGSSVSKEEIEDMVRTLVENQKIRYQDLDPELKAKLSGSVKVALTLNTPKGTGKGGELTLQQLLRPLFQKMLSDFKARNNVYLYGGAGTGKTYVAEQLADFLGYTYVEVNCNQFTSPLDLIGGQTINGYQKGKLEMAWTNVKEDGSDMKGALLCLDELPKLDPNTAGLLNAALAKLRNKTSTKNVFIYNGRGQQIELKNMMVIATGNTQLNETSVEYEANFKQDLSLQDRFVGSTYLVVPDYRSEYEVIMKGFTFIFLYMTKLREFIIERRLTGIAFVSIRIMQSMKATYIVSRDPEFQQINSETAIANPKTLKDSLDSFLRLFKDTQIEAIKAETDYEDFIRTIQRKDNMPLDALDTPDDLSAVEIIISENERLQQTVND
tara:strand:- start:195 stop:1532 length:1338 start_codon:yes stop_codon:yes gene_type:complete